MEPTLHLFIIRFASVVLASLLPVILVAFLSIPYTLQGHPGDLRADNSPMGLHMT